MIQSVVSQWPASRVLLTVSETVELPRWIRRSGIQTVRSADYGAFKKHSPTYLRLGVDRYIVVDDDSILPIGWLDNLVQWSERLPGSVVCGSGRFWPAGVPLQWAHSERLYGCDLNSPAKTDIYIGSGTALFEPGFFEDSVFPFDDPGFGEPGHSNWIGGDDIWFSAKLRQEIPIFVVPFASAGDRLTYPEELSYAGAPGCLWLSERSRGFAGWDRAVNHFQDRFTAKTR